MISWTFIILNCPVEEIMVKITIETTNDNKTIVTYDNGSIVYPICDIDENNFHISEVTDIIILKLISQVINECGKSLEYQLNKQGFVNKPLNNHADGK